MFQCIKTRQSAIKYFKKKWVAKLHGMTLEKGLFPYQSLQWLVINMNCLNVTHFRMNNDYDNHDIGLIFHPHLT